MAKSNSFFGLRRGSTKSLTFQVLDGKQVTKDRVSVVANPKTSAQATQRQKLLPAVRFQAIFHDLIDHSWENLQYGQKSIQHFMMLALKATAPNGMYKGQTGWVPNPYPISAGSLPTIGAYKNYKTDSSDNFEFPCNGPADYDELLQFGQFEEGDQLTCIAVRENGSVDGNIIYTMAYDRLIINRENVADLSDLVMSTQNNRFTVKFSDEKITCNTNGGALVAVAVVHSRRTSSKWLRSTETLDCDVREVSAADAIPSYMQRVAAKTSPWYLNAADNDVISPADVEGGEWSPVMLGPSSTWGTGDTIYLGAKNNLYGNYAVITSDGSSNGFAFSFAGLSSDTTINVVTLADFTQSQTRGNAVLPAAVARYANFGSSTLTALADGQPDQFLKASIVGK